MSEETVYITANPTPNPECMKFIVDRQLVDGDPVSYQGAGDAEGSPLATALFDLGGVASLFAYQNFITVTKEGEQPWQQFAREIGKTIRGFIQTGATEYFKPAASAENGDQSEDVAKIRAVLDEIQPYVAADGGAISFAGYSDGVVQVFMQGSCSGCPSSTVTLKAGIEEKLRAVLPGLKEVVAIS
ncbi:NifU family protein [Acanthopleuribacter pedis]|uniref:NifU family protein n=1 Tax=Acanthopleuribacter pedis TaxID=442870 RepID=A0A8J7Q9K0_9BACT|nr:NifU family protein [Acanthopleuribacter pedis]MBO1321166.1 NifU family protein [Acanthopleuribacter pedis]